MKVSTMDSSDVLAAAWDGLEVRMNASSVGLLSIRVAAAAARRRVSGSVNERDIQSLRLATEDLRDEARVLRRESSPDADDETAYAFAGVALTALAATDPTQEATEGAEELAAVQLDALADDLALLASGADISEEMLERIERLFFSANAIAARRLGGTGETLEGSPHDLTVTG